MGVLGLEEQKIEVSQSRGLEHSGDFRSDVATDVTSLIQRCAIPREYMVTRHACWTSIGAAEGGVR